MKKAVSKSAAVLLALGLGFGMAYGAMGEKCGQGTSQPVEKCGAGKCGDNRIKPKAAPGKCGQAKCDSGKAMEKCGAGKCGDNRVKPKTAPGKCGSAPR